MLRGDAGAERELSIRFKFKFAIVVDVDIVDEVVVVADDAGAIVGCYFIVLQIVKSYVIFFYD